MRAAVIDGYGGSDRFAVREIARPEAGSGQVLVRVRAASVNPLDWKLRQGRLRIVMPLRFPAVLGFDLAGEVEAVGPEVTRFAPGDAVYASVDTRGGAYAEYAVVRETSLAAKPEELSFEAAAAVPVAGLTALQALRDRGELIAGESLLVNGAAGGVGHFAVQIGAALGARVTGVAGGKNQEFVRGLGAAQTLDYTQEDFVWAEDTYAVVFDAAGTRSFRDCEPVLAEDGTYVTTAVGPAIAMTSLFTSLTGLFGRSRRARFVSVHPSGDDLRLLSSLIGAGKLRPALEQVYPLAEVGAAHLASESGHTRGKIVIRID